MKNLFSLSILVFLLGTTSLLNAQETYIQIDPTLTPDGQTIIFSYDGDLWKVPSNGGEAYRLTAMDGEETLPRVSPDGKWLAFSSTQYGNKDVYVMPINGGEIKQLTFHSAADDVDSWSWDSKEIYFTSSRYNRFSGYKVSITGNTPLRLFENYFNNVHNVVVHPKTGEIFFNESWESKMFTHRKRYKGAYNPDIKSYNPKTKEFKKHTNYIGKDMWATIDKNGSIYFVSDEENGEYNLYTLKGNTKTALTNFDTSIGWPQVSANGNKVVFSKDYQIFLFDVATNKTEKVKIQINVSNTLNKSQDFDVKGEITNFSISPDNKKMAFISRGELFVSDTKGKFIKKINTNPKERVKEVKWLKDNKTLLFNQTVSGYTNLFTISADGSGNEKRISNEEKNDVSIVLDHKMENAAYISGRDELRLIDLKTFKSTTILKDEFWALDPPSPQFSPDDNYILYSAFRNFELDLFTYHIPTKKITNLTNTGVSESNPAWSPDGKYIYFESNLTQPRFPTGTADTHIYRVALDKFDTPFKSEKFNELFKEDDKREKDKLEKKKEKKEKKEKEKEKEKDSIKEPITISLNTKDLMDRIELISPQFGSQNDVFLIDKDDTTYVYFFSNHDKGKQNLWRTIIKPFEKNKTEKVDDMVIENGQLYQVGKDYFALLNGSIYTMNLSDNKLSKIETKATFRKDLANEFTQMFYEAWAGFESNYYDEGFHGENWQQLRDKYAQYLPFITKRSQLSLLFNDMLGELNTSHFGFYSSGKENETFYNSSTLETGIIFSEHNPYKVERIVNDGPADIKGMDIKPGDVLTHVKGKPVDATINREKYFSEPSLDSEIQLTFKRNGKEIQVNLHPIPSNKFKDLLYDEWVATNQQYVDKKSDDKIAYVHMKNMSNDELQNFMKEMVSEAYKKDALILDLRNNTGGNVHDAVLQFLSQKPYTQWKYRDGKLSPQPNFTPGSKPMVLLINEQTLSDAEVTAAGFKELGLGKVIGTETYRWIIFTSAGRLIDGSVYRLPSWGCYTLSGDDLELTGVKPDIYVKEDFKDRLLGNQPQLDSAINEILKELKK
ncbi:PDZ domain-containing protein [Aequorivita sp. H23M31]|uniref:Tricorn protease homolog n=1 Tax=Aequorivita ciconiae TaxID=2494375 RepID=A0A410G671_9FLAO|nr:S41 family peptidase [Aequorivita sp. H23M31]QAA82740.1 PDZ domain-containing protein [Aequorivita sp. H23M31]